MTDLWPEEEKREVLRLGQDSLDKKASTPFLGGRKLRFDFSPCITEMQAALSSSSFLTGTIKLIQSWDNSVSFALIHNPF